MSAQQSTKRVTPPALRNRKGQRPIVALTAYTAPMAKRLDEIVDLILVGDSLGMVLYGMESTLGVGLDLMIAHGRAVSAAAKRALVVVDMPFGCYQASPQEAFNAAARVMAETGCGAVKLEGGKVMAETVAFLVARGIPVLGHVGLTPQSVNSLGGYGTRGRAAAEAEAIADDAAAVAEAGAFAVVLEGVTEPLAREITEKLPVPTIGIGASPACDGQVLVTEDILGLFSDFTPRFVRRYADLGPDISRAVAAYAEDVQARRFPGPEHCVSGPDPVKPAPDTRRLNVYRP